MILIFYRINHLTCLNRYLKGNRKDVLKTSLIFICRIKPVANLKALLKRLIDRDRGVLLITILHWHKT